MVHRCVFLFSVGRKPTMPRIFLWNCLSRSLSVRVQFREVSRLPSVSSCCHEMLLYAGPLFSGETAFV